MNSHFPTPPRHHTRSSSNTFTPPQNLSQHSFNPSNSSDHINHSNNNNNNNHNNNNNNNNNTSHHLNNSSSNSHGSSTVLDWAAWTDESPELTRRISHGNNNPDSDISMEGNTFMDPFNHSMINNSAEFTGLNMEIDGDRSLTRLGTDNEVDLEKGKNGSFSKQRVRTRLQSRNTMSPTPIHPYVLSSPLSPNSSRYYTKEALSHSPPIAPNYESVYPSPFRQELTSSLATMDPAHSVRSISPSETESVSGLGHSRMGSVSAASSVFDGDYGGSVGDFSASVRSFSESPQKARRPTLSRRDSLSPRKTKRPGKLTNAERKKICLHREAFPETRQDTIGDKFGVERSTISKILKNKARWLALPSDDEEETSPRQLSPAPSPFKSSQAASQSSIYPTVNLTFHPSSSTLSSPEKPKVKGTGRYPELDEKLTDWVRSQIGAGAALPDDVLISKAKEIARSLKGCESFKASPAWIERFKIRVGILGGSLLDPVKVDCDRESLTTSIRPSFDAVPPGVASPRDTKRKRHSTAGISRRTLSMSTSPLPTTMEVEVHTPPREQHSDLESTPTRTKRGLAESKAHQATLNEDFTIEDDPVSSLRSARTPPTRRQNSLSQSHSSTLSAPPFHNVDGSPSHYPFSYAGNVGGGGRGGGGGGGGGGGAAVAVAGAAAAGAGGSSQFSNSSYFYPEQPYPLQSPFQATAQSFFPQNGTSVSSSTSGANSPGGSYQHNRSGSTASTTSSFSGLTAFSSRNEPGTPLSGSHYGSFSNAQSSSTSGSLPSTPATGYFGHGPNGTQSQLQAVFVQEQYSFPGLSQPQPNPLARRATISGSTPYNSGGSTPSTKSTHATMRQSMNRASPSEGASSPTGGEVSFDQAYASLQTALEYLSTNGNGYVSAVDLVVLSDLRTKMQSSTSSPQPRLAASPAFSTNPTTSNTISELRIKMERANSGGLSSGIRTRGSAGGIGGGR